MFKKLLSNLPFNPSLINQLSFYAQRLRNETRLRQMGLICVVLAMFIQVFAVVRPPEPTLASSDNDIIRGGFANRDQATLHCLNQASDFKDILAYFGVNCDILARAETRQLRSDEVYDQHLPQDQQKYLYSLGRNPLGQRYAGTGKLTDERRLEIPNAKQRYFYLRQLRAWDSRAYSTYTALRMTNVHGQVIEILYNCGNIVTRGPYSPPAPPTPEPTPTPPAPTPQPDTPVKLPDRPTPVPLEPDCPYDVSIKKTDERCKPCPYNNNLLEGSPQCKPCEASKDIKDQVPCIELKKEARNVTQKIADANNTTAKPGDIIEYTLTTTYKGLGKVDNYDILEDLSDVLNYATVEDKNGGDLENKKLTWFKVDIAAGASVEKKFTIKVMNPIPSTPSSTSNPAAYDLIMTNWYGNSINIKLPGSIIKTTEITTKELPNTGPGETLAVVVALTVVVSYFFARSRLLAQEVEIVRDEYKVSGGSE